MLIQSKKHQPKHQYVMAANYQPSLRDYLSIIRRRAVLLTVTSSVIFIGALVIAFVWPPVFQSTGTILIEAQQIPNELVQTTVTGFAEETIDVISQRVMTRENLLKIIDKYKVFQQDREVLSAPELVDRLRKRIKLEIVGADIVGARRGRSTITFNLSFEDSSPFTAHQVTDGLVTLFLNENVRTRTERATETTEFLSREADRLKVDLETIEQQIAAYKRVNGNSLPEHQGLRVSMLARVEADLRNMEREYSATQDELRFLDLELSAVKLGVGTPLSQEVHLSPVQELEKLKVDYAKLSSSYTESHPDLRAMKRKMEELNGNLGKDGTTTVASVGSSMELAIAKVQAKMATANNRLKSLSQQEKELRADRNSLEKQIIESPQIERGIATLMRDHESAHKKYEELRSKELSAKTAENLEGEQKAERFSLLEPPLLPEKPIKPNRGKIILIGFFAALGGSTGLAFLLEMLHPRIRGSAELVAVLRHRPLAVIPYMFTEADKARKQQNIRTFVQATMVSSVLALFAVHFFYMSLDRLILKIISKF
ncbi:GumC family protein [Propionivibrio sp.]|uniref:GumC family protein n=1 Tax=Propionivibrio sp. TaxID=2212460 RepID=UPI003BF441A5